MKKLLTLLLLVVVLGIVACSTAPVSQTTPTTSTPTEPVYEQIDTPTTNRFIAVTSDHITSLSLQKVEFVAREPNEFNDASSLQKVPGLFMYLAYLDVTYAYVQPANAPENLYLKIIGKSQTDDLDTVYYSGPLVDGGETVRMETGVQTPVDTPRMNFCVGANPDFDPTSTAGDVACKRLVAQKPAPSFFAIRDNLRVVFDLPPMPQEGAVFEGEGSVLIKNSGTVPLTLFITAKQPPKTVALSYDPEYVLLQPEEEQLFTVTASWTYDGGFVPNTELLVYALPDECVGTFTCAQNSRIKEEFDLLFKNN